MISDLFSNSNRSVLNDNYFLQLKKKSTNQSFIGGTKNGASSSYIASKLPSYIGLIELQKIGQKMMTSMNEMYYPFRIMSQPNN